MNIKERLDAILTRIERTCNKCGRNKDSVTLVGVSKKQPIHFIQHFIDLCAGRGIPCIIGENYLQEFSTKKAELRGEYEAHFIGHLQSNKVIEVSKLFDCVQSVDSLKIAHKISHHGEKNEATAKIFLEVNISEEEGKFGFYHDDIEIREVLKLPGLEVRGLMTIPRHYDEDEYIRRDFKRLADFGRTLQSETGRTIPFELSMGMSQDFELAIEEGATMVRIGSLLFGERH